MNTENAEKTPRRFFLPLVLTALGALIGYLYYHFIGCATGRCPITSNPYISTVYGSVFGFLIAAIIAPQKKKEQEEKTNA